MLHAIIVDDELHCIERLRNLLTVHCSDFLHVEGSFQTIEDGIKAIRNLRTDVVFLDVELNGKTGFDLLNQCDQKNFEVIFTTAYDKYAVQAFRFSAIDYLLKPVDPDDLKQAVLRIQKRTNDEDMRKKMDSLFYNIQNLPGNQKKITVPTMQGLEFFQVSDIVRLESNVNYTSLFLKSGQKIVVAKTLKQFEQLLTDFNFFRVHNSHLINLNCIQSYKKGKGGVIVMSDHSEIEVSTRRKDEFLKRLSDL
jgi:two-component system LytT family response regulator